MKKSLLWFLLPCLTLSCITAFAQDYDDVIASSEALIRTQMTENPVPGFAIAVMVDGEVVWSDGYGYADLEQQVPMTPYSKLRIGSVSKPMAAAAAMRLLDQGKLNINAPVQEYVSYFPEKRWEVTTRQIAGHLGGIRHYRGEEFLSTQPYATVEEGLQVFLADTLMHSPGSAFLYSSYGWNLVSAVIEGAANASFLQVLEEEVLDPLGLEHTAADYPDSLITQRVRFYERSPGGSFINGPYVDNSLKWAGGGLLSSVIDLVHFGDAHLTEGYLSEAALETLFTSLTLPNGEATRYGFGWFTEMRAGRPYYWHGGGSVGGSTMLIMQPEARVVVATHANLTAASIPGQLANEILALFIEARESSEE